MQVPPLRISGSNNASPPPPPRAGAAAQERPFGTVEVLAIQGAATEYTVRCTIDGQARDVVRRFADFVTLHGHLSETLGLEPAFPIDPPATMPEVADGPTPVELEELRRSFERKSEALTRDQLTEYIASLITAASAAASMPTSLTRFLGVEPAAQVVVSVGAGPPSSAPPPRPVSTAAAGGFMFTLPSKRELAQIDANAPSERIQAAKARAAKVAGGELGGESGGGAVIDSPRAQAAREAATAAGVGAVSGAAGAPAEEGAARHATHPAAAAAADLPSGGNYPPPATAAERGGDGGDGAKPNGQKGGGSGHGGDDAGSQAHGGGSVCCGDGPCCAWIGGAAEYFGNGCCFGSLMRAASRRWERLVEEDEEEARERYASHAPLKEDHPTAAPAAAAAADGGAGGAGGAGGQPIARETAGRPLAKQGRFASIAAQRRGGGSRQNRAIMLVVVCAVGAVCVATAWLLNSPGLFLGEIPGLGDGTWLWQVLPSSDAFPGTRYTPRDRTGAEIESSVFGLDACRLACRQDPRCHGLVYVGGDTACAFKGGPGMEPDVLWRRRRAAASVELHILWGRHEEPPAPPPPLAPSPSPPRERDVFSTSDAER